MPGPWIDLATFRVRIGDLLQKADPSTLKVKDSALQDSLTAAANNVTNILLGRQYTLAQIDAWDSRVEYNVDIALYWAFSRGAIPGNYSDTFIKTFDRRNELKESVFKLVCAGTVVRPGSDGQTTAGATIGYGPIAVDVSIPRWDGRRPWDGGYGSEGRW